MIELCSRREEEFSVPAEQLWGVVADFGSLADWWPAGLLERVDIEGAGVGMVRSIHTLVGIVLHERLEALDDTTRNLELSIVGDLPAGMQEYRATGSVREAPAGGCSLVWEGRYKVPDQDAEAGARGFIEGAYTVMFKGLRDFTAKEGG